MAPVQALAVSEPYDLVVSGSNSMGSMIMIHSLSEVRRVISPVIHVDVALG